MASKYKWQGKCFDKALSAGQGASDSDTYCDMAAMMTIMMLIMMIIKIASQSDCLDLSGLYQVISNVLTRRSAQAKVPLTASDTRDDADADCNPI